MITRSFEVHGCFDSSPQCWNKDYWCYAFVSEWQFSSSLSLCCWQIDFLASHWSADGNHERHSITLSRAVVCVWRSLRRQFVWWLKDRVRTCFKLQELYFWRRGTSWQYPSDMFVLLFQGRRGTRLGNPVTRQITKRMTMISQIMIRSCLFGTRVVECTDLKYCIEGEHDTSFAPASKGKAFSS